MTVTAATDIRPVSTRRDRDAFVKLPWTIYRADPHWIPPLIADEKKFIDPDHNPFFHHGNVEHFLAWRDGTPVGRIAAIHNHLHNEFHDDRVGFFGLFESIDDPEVARALFDAVADWLGARGLTTMRGPMNYSTNDTCGLLVDGEPGPPFIMMTHNPPYYPALVESAGFGKAKDLIAFIITGDDVDHERLTRVEKVLTRRIRADVRMRTMVKKCWDEEVELIRHVYNNAWERNWGFVPFTEAEFDHMAKEMKPVVDPDLVGILEVDGQTAGFVLGLPDMNLAIRKANGRLFPFGLIKILIAARGIKRFRVPILGLLPEYRGLGYDTLLYFHMVKTGLAKGYEAAEMSWILEDNLPIRRGLERLGGRLFRTYRIYDRSLR